MPAIVIRDIERVSEMREVEALQKDVWGSDELDVVPMTMFVASKEVGAVLIGDEEEEIRAHIPRSVAYSPVPFQCRNAQEPQLSSRTARRADPDSCC